MDNRNPLFCANLGAAAVRSLDTRRCAVFANNKKIEKLAYESGESTGERVWPFPHGEDYKGALMSENADILQCNPKPNADHIYAATFLSEFISGNPDWIHMDLSAESHPGGLGLISSDTTGIGMRWGLEVCKKYFGV